MAAVHTILLLKKKLIILMMLRRKSQSKVLRRKRLWIRKIFQDREHHGEFQRLVHDHRLFDNYYFFKNFRMCPEQFERQLSWVGPYIAKTSKTRPNTTPDERLIVTLRYLATGDAQFTIASSYRISPTTVGRIICETTGVIWDVFCENGYMTQPSHQQNWKRIDNEFNELWNFPNCLGAIDGKHVTKRHRPERDRNIVTIKNHLTLY